MTPVEIITAVKDVFLAVAAATTATVAVIGLKSWSRELKGKAAFETARSLARATYKLRDELSNCRSPFIWAHEFPDSYRSAGPSRTAQQRAEGYAHVYFNRWAPVSAALQEFDAQTLEAEALWGAESRANASQLRQCVFELNAAIDAYVSDASADNQDFSSDPEFGKRMRSAISASPNSSDNELSVKIEKAVNTVEQHLRPHLRRG